MPNIYAFLDKKSGVLCNHFISDEPWSKVQQSISISLLQLSLKDPTNPFVLYAKDYDLVFVDFVECLYGDCAFDDPKDADKCISLNTLLTASRSAYAGARDHTSQTDELNNQEE